MNRTKGAQHQNTSGRGCAWYAGQNICTQGTTANCTQAGRLIEGVHTDYLLADRGYDSNAIVEQAKKQKWKLLSHQKRIEKYKDLMIMNCIN